MKSRAAKIVEFFESVSKKYESPCDVYKMKDSYMVKDEDKYLEVKETDGEMEIVRSVDAKDFEEMMDDDDIEMEEMADDAELSADIKKHLPEMKKKFKK